MMLHAEISRRALSPYPVFSCQDISLADINQAFIKCPCMYIDVESMLHSDHQVYDADY